MEILERFPKRKAVFTASCHHFLPGDRRIPALHTEIMSFSRLVSVFLVIGLAMAAGCSGRPPKPEDRTPSQDRPVILITAFDPFGGASVNQSSLVAEALKNQLTEFDPKVCILETKYDRGAEMALECLASLPVKPAIVLSLGEGACDIRLETQAQNWDADGRDNAGVGRFGQTIIHGLPMWNPLEFPVEIMRAAPMSSEDRKLVNISKSAGNYVCNNTAFRLSHRFNQPDDAIYGFIHVPNHRCPAKVRNPDRLANILRSMLETAF